MTTNIQWFRQRVEGAVMGNHQWVFLFREGDAQMRDLLGGKGANLAEMTNAGLPVPPGFTITTETCNAYINNNGAFPEGSWDQVEQGLRDVEQQMGRTL